MNIELLDLLNSFYSMLWPMLRISAFLLFTSIYSIRAVNLRIRISLSIVLTIFIAMQMEFPVKNPFEVDGLVTIFNELFIGFAMGMVMQLVTAAVVVAGQAISASMGLTMANLIDPNLGNVPTISQFLSLLTTLIFVATGGHLIVFGVLLESFQLLPIGQSLFTQVFFGKFIQWSSLMFGSAVLIALPILVTLMFVNIGMGFMTRAAPSLNIFSVGFPAMILVGFVILWMALPSITGRIAGLWVAAFTAMRELPLARGG